MAREGFCKMDEEDCELAPRKRRSLSLVGLRTQEWSFFICLGVSCRHGGERVE